MTTNDETIRDAIRLNATGPRKHSESEAGAATEQHSPQDQIAADKYLANKDGLSGTNLPVRRVRTTTPGAGEY